MILDEDRDPVMRLETAVQCLPQYDPSQHWNKDRSSFLYWTIRDYAHAYRSKITTPSIVSSSILFTFLFYEWLCVTKSGIRGWGIVKV